MPFMRNKLLLLVFASVFFVFSSIAQYATGLSFNDDVYERTSMISPALKFSSQDLPVYSLKSHCPTPGNQGSIGSCVGWATGYAALTISDAVKSGNTSRSSITGKARSAMYIYFQIAEKCPDGSVISDALTLVKTKGDCLHAEFGSSPCGTSIPSTIHGQASQFKIKDYYTLFNIGATTEQKISATRNSIAAKKPVVIGMVMTTSFNNVGSAGIYKPWVGEPSIGGHAMTVIGYDDMNKTFELINSWGTSWGDGGFFKMSYEDYARQVKYGYQFILDEIGPPTGKEVNLTGNFNFRKFAGYDSDNNKYKFADAPVSFDGKYYAITNVKVNDFFRIRASNVTKDKYVYIFSIKPDKSAELLFPTNKKIDAVTVKDIPIVPSNNATIEIPVDEKKGLTTDMAGNDMLCILYSADMINDIDDVVVKMKGGSGDFLVRLQAALGNRLIPATDIRYDPSVMGLTVKSNRGVIAPIILKVSVN